MLWASLNFALAALNLTFFVFSNTKARWLNLAVVPLLLLSAIFDLSNPT